MKVRAFEASIDQTGDVLTRVDFKDLSIMSDPERKEVLDPDDAVIDRYYNQLSDRKLGVPDSQIELGEFIEERDDSCDHYRMIVLEGAWHDQETSWVWRKEGSQVVVVHRLQRSNVPPED